MEGQFHLASKTHEGTKVNREALRTWKVSRQYYKRLASESNVV